MPTVEAARARQQAADDGLGELASLFRYEILDPGAHGQKLLLHGSAAGGGETFAHGDGSDRRQAQKGIVT
ncbi:hypothetical protein GGD63_006265 [Bradyrhizobium sp. cir1]|uniref:hypothetical protein n=1 Tax=Bradyrhizobium sp. cir1 TaxID=1445730 RepID=UPI00160580A9|nr:hypothetical protein [Bradyrhizobium sp. cir1]MBB4373442.1 hypothetical protein [Bradyrhizobium sp. cir1]